MRVLKHTIYFVFHIYIYEVFSYPFVLRFLNFVISLVFFFIPIL